MKKRGLLTMTTLVLLALFVLFSYMPVRQQAASSLTEKLTRQKQTFVFPNSLLSIGDSAFEGTAAGFIILPENLVKISHRVFADSPHLIAIYIPSSIMFIADDALEGVLNISVIGERGSYAHKWSEENGLRFYSPAMYTAELNQSPLESVSRPYIAYDVNQNGFNDNHLKTSARMVGEIKDQKYKGRASLYIRDRFFP